MTSPLVRIPFVLGATIAFHRAITPPFPAPNADEIVTSTFLEIVLAQTLIPHMVAIIGWFAAIPETLVILATRYHEDPLATVINSLLVYKETTSAEHIQPTRVFFLGTCMTMAGSSIRLSCFRALGHLFTYEMSIRKDHQLVTHGPYGIVRHPGYASILLMASGTFLWVGSSGSWAIECGAFQTTLGQLLASIYVATVSIVVFSLLIRMFKEDEQLRRTFGREWDEWAKRVPYLIIPWLY